MTMTPEEQIIAAWESVASVTGGHFGCVRAYKDGVHPPAGLTQDELARRSGIGVKTISSFETSQRVSSIKIKQLLAICAVLVVSVTEFFAALPLSQRRAPSDPLACFRTRSDSPYPSPQSSLREVG